jgi:putative endonuclease
MRAKDALGSYGEQVAVQHLRDLGFAVLARNWRCDAGELDVVARDGETVVFCEVKTRSSTAFGLPSEAVGRVKANRLHRLAMRWLEEHRETVGFPEIRFDVISVLRSTRGAAQIEHLRAAL